MGLIMTEGEDMKACPEYQELLYMDLLGELSPKQEREWKTHLEECPVCRRERVKIGHLFKIARDSSPPPRLEPGEAAKMRARITEALYPDKSLSWFSFFRRRWKTIIPATAAAVCLFWISIVSLNTWWPRRHSPSSQKKVSASTQDRNNIEDPELIKDMELLEQIDTLRMLVKVVDNKDII